MPMQTARVSWRIHLTAAAITSVAALALCSSASARPTVVAVSPGATGVSAYSDAVAWSKPNGEGGWLLFARVGGRVERVPAAPSADPFDVDLGPGPDGSIWAVYSRCRRKNRCRLFRYSFGSRTELPLPGSGGSKRETNPSIWKGTVAFTNPSKGYGVYTRSAITGKGLSRQPGVGRRGCARRSRSICARSADAELYGRQIAVLRSLEHPRFHYIERREILLGTVGRRGRVVARNWGDFTYFGGPGFDRGRLFFAIFNSQTEPGLHPECSSWYRSYRRIVSYRRGHGYKSAPAPYGIFLGDFAKRHAGYFSVDDRGESVVTADDPAMRRSTAPIDPRTRIFPERCAEGEGP